MALKDSLKSVFDSFSPHIKVAHEIFREHLNPGDHVFDATCGNGNDTLLAASLVFPNGKVMACDLQEEALQKSKTLLGPLSQLIDWRLGSHAEIPYEIPNRTLALAIYNLGYLPGGNKTFTTQKESTIESLSIVLEKLKVGGILSVTTYSAHPGGEKEERAVETFLASLERKKFGVISFSWSNRPTAPKLFLVKLLA
jgi:SAM-dependent methyltransferase